MELNELTRERLTDDRTYRQVKDIAEGHARAGRTPDIDQLRYIKLAEYETREKDMNDEIEQAFREGYCVGYNRGRVAHYTEKLEDKHWEECRQIAHYDNELKCAMKLLTEALGKVSAEWDEAAQGLIMAQRVK